MRGQGIRVGVMGLAIGAVFVVRAFADAPAADVPKGAVATLAGMFVDGGPIMWPILACSVLMLALFFERLVSLRRGAVFPRVLRSRAAELVGAGKTGEASDLCAASNTPFGRLLHACLERADAPGFEMEVALEEAGSRALFDLRRNSKAMGVIADIAPLLGLMGTVTGMIKAFNVVAASGALGRTELLARGISEALLTTAFGLLVAIPSLLAYNYSRSKAEILVREMEDACIEVLIRLRRTRHGA